MRRQFREALKTRESCATSLVTSTYNCIRGVGGLGESSRDAEQTVHPQHSTSKYWCWVLESSRYVAIQLPRYQATLTPAPALMHSRAMRDSFSCPSWLWCLFRLLVLCTAAACCARYAYRWCLLLCCAADAHQQYVNNAWQCPAS